MISPAITPPSEWYTKTNRTSCFHLKHLLFGFLTLALLSLRIYATNFFMQRASLEGRAWIRVLVIVGHWLFAETLFTALVRWMWRFAVHETSKPAVVAELASATFVVLCFTSGVLLQKAIGFTISSIKGRSAVANDVIMYLFNLNPMVTNLVPFVIYLAFEILKLFVAMLATPENFCAFALDGVVMGTCFGVLLSLIAALGALWRHTVKLFDNKDQFSKCAAAQEMLDAIFLPVGWIWARGKKTRRPYRFIFTKTGNKRIKELLYPSITEHNMAVDDDGGGVVFHWSGPIFWAILPLSVTVFGLGYEDVYMTKSLSFKAISFAPLSTLETAGYTILAALSILFAMAPKSFRLMLQWRRLAFPKGTRNDHKDELMYYCAGNSEWWRRGSGGFTEINCVGSNDTCALSTTVGRLKRARDISGEGMLLWLSPYTVPDRPLEQMAAARRTPEYDMMMLDDFSDDDLVVS